MLRSKYSNLINLFQLIYSYPAEGDKGFLRQRPISNFIADFMCKELMLVIEVDGITHEWEETQIKDQIKEEALTNMGFTLLRFTDDEVLAAINGVSNKIEQFIDGFEKRLNHPLSPPTAGENSHGIQLH